MHHRIEIFGKEKGGGDAESPFSFILGRRRVLFARDRLLWHWAKNIRNAFALCFLLFANAISTQVDWQSHLSLCFRQFDEPWKKIRCCLWMERTWARGTAAVQSADFWQHFSSMLLSQLRLRRLRSSTARLNVARGAKRLTTSLSDEGRLRLWTEQYYYFRPVLQYYLAVGVSLLESNATLFLLPPVKDEEESI